MFHYGRARFTDEEFDAQGIDAEQRHLLEYMANQEVGHATVIGNMLQGQGAKMCKYRYDFETVQEFIQFSAVRLSSCVCVYPSFPLAYALVLFNRSLLDGVNLVFMDFCRPSTLDLPLSCFCNPSPSKLVNK